MTPRSLFIIIIRIFGLLFIRDLLSVIGEIIAVIPVALSNDTGAVIGTSITVVLVLAFYTFIAWFLIFKPGTLIDKFKLDKGFDEETLPLNIHRSTVLTIALIVMGGLILVDEIPSLCRRAVSYYEQSQWPLNKSNTEMPYIVLSVVKIVIGFLLLVEHRKIVNFIERKRKGA